jgi:UDP-glucose 4-epimerase
MRVLVTGGLGFTGKVVVDALVAHGHEVTTLSSRASASLPAPTQGHVVHQDLRDRAGTARVVAALRPDAVCHLAARTRVRDSLADPVGYFDVNVAGTVNLLAAVEAAPTGPHRRPPRLVFASTAAVYGAQEGALREDAATTPAHPYGASKLAAEQLIGHQAATGRLAAVTLRCFNISGAVDEPDLDTTRIIPKALAVAAGEADRVQVNGNGSAVREYTHVVDVAHAYLLALDAAEPGAHLILNVGSGRGSSVAEVLQAAERITRRSIPVEHVPPRPEPRVLIADGARIRRHLHWEPRCSDLDTLITDSWKARCRGNSGAGQPQ